MSNEEFLKDWILENYSIGSLNESSYIVEYTRTEVLNALAAGTVILRFTKKSTGKKRNMYCTRNLNLIPPEHHPSGSGSPSKNPDHIRVFDLVTNAWRSFLIPNIDKNKFKSGRLGFLDRTVFKSKWRSKHESGEFKSFGDFLTESKNKTLYVKRKLTTESANNIKAWARSIGLKSCIKNKDMHVTIIYSKTPCNWHEIVLNEKELVLPKTNNRTLEFLGEKNDVLVLSLPNTPELTSRHKYFLSKGAKSDFPNYKAHITITWDSSYLEKEFINWIKPFDGKIILKGETREEIDNTFSKPIEQPL